MNQEPLTDPTYSRLKAGSHEPNKCYAFKFGSLQLCDVNIKTSKNRDKKIDKKNKNPSKYLQRIGIGIKVRQRRCRNIFFAVFKSLIGPIASSCELLHVFVL